MTIWRAGWGASALLAAMVWAGGANAQACGGALRADGSNPCPDAATFRTAIGAGSSTSSSASGIAIPVCPNGAGCPTTGAPDIYPIPMAVAIPASTTPNVICKVSPAASTTVVVKKWTAGNPASSSTLGTFTVSTSCAISGTAISATSFSAGDGISAEATQASADASAVISVAIPFNKQ